MMNADQPPLEFETVAKLDAHLRGGRPLTASSGPRPAAARGADAAAARGRRSSAYSGGAVAHALSDKAWLCRRHPVRSLRGIPTPVKQDLYAGYAATSQAGMPRPATPGSTRTSAPQAAPTRRTSLESLYRRLHDHGMSDALEKEVWRERRGGDHGRTDRPATRIRATSPRWTRAGARRLRGGDRRRAGEPWRQHLAWHAGRRDEDLRPAIAILGHAPLTPSSPGRYGTRGPAPPRRRPPGAEHRHPDVALRPQPSDVFPTAIAKKWLP
jgi:hypothetical protein